MSPTTLRRYVIVVVLAAALTLAGASPANARDFGTAGQAWLWLQQAWTQGISALWDWHGSKAPSPSRPVGWVPMAAKMAYGLDPNGAPAAQSPASPVCDTCNG